VFECPCRLRTVCSRVVCSCSSWRGCSLKYHSSPNCPSLLERFQVCAAALYLCCMGSQVIGLSNKAETERNRCFQSCLQAYCMHSAFSIPFLQAQRPVTTHSCFLQQQAAAFSSICCFFSHSCNKHDVLLRPPFASCSNMQRHLATSAAFFPILATSTTSCYNPLLFPAATCSDIQQHLLLFFLFLQQAQRSVTTPSCFLQQHAATFSNFCCFFPILAASTTFCYNPLLFPAATFSDICYFVVILCVVSRVHNSKRWYLSVVCYLLCYL